MRKLVLAAAALVVLGGGLLSVEGASAASAIPAALLPVIDTTDHVEQIAHCWRRGWHRWGRFRCHASRRLYGPRVTYWHRPYRYSYRWRYHYWR